MTEPTRVESPLSGSRREFIKSTTGVVVAGGLASLAMARGAHAALADDTIKVGLIGCGGRGTGAAAQALRTQGSVKLVAMADAFADNLEFALSNLQKDDSVKNRLDVPKERRFSGFDAFRQVLDAGVDMVILATPPGFRPQHLKAAVEANKHVFMEKPVAVDAPGVRSVLESTREAKKKNLALGCGLQRHHQANYLETIRRLQDGAIGEIIASRVYWNGAGVWVRPKQPGQTEMEYQMRNWYYFNWLSGDHIVEQHIHNLDVINWLKNDHPVSAEGMGGRQVRVGGDYGEIYDHHAVEFTYADGSRMFSYCRHIPNCWESVSEHAHGSKGSCDISAARIEVKGGENWRFRGEVRDPYQVEHDDLFASIRAGKPLNEGEYGAHSSMTSILGRMATYSGQVINWDEAIASDLSLAPKELHFQATPPTAAVAVPGVTKVV